jgi:5-methyltetrahydrofolate--homocysteine methyltransferase
VPPFWGSRVVKGLQLADYASYLDERATFMGQWGLKGARSGSGPTYEELVETDGRPRLRAWLERLHTENLLEAAVVYGYFPCWSEGDDLVIAHVEGDGAAGRPGTERLRFTFPRQRRGRRLCLADFFRAKDPPQAGGAPTGETDVVAFQLVTVGNRVSEATAELFERNAYRDYLELHGLSVQLAEALAEAWHARVRAEFGVGGEDSAELTEILRLGYRGARFSLGYGACPNLEDRAKITELLQPERIGVKLSEEFQLHPEQSTSAIVVLNPQAKYFSV